ATHDVGRLDVAVDETLGVRCRQPSRGVEVGGEDRAPPRPGALPAPALERLALHELHRDEDFAPVLADVVDLHHVWMRQLPESARLANEALGSVQESAAFTGPT